MKITMLFNDLIGIILYFAYFAAAALFAFLIKHKIKMPRELFRKILHLIVVMSILPLLKLFSAWYLAVLATFLFVLIVYPVLSKIEKTTLFRELAPERSGGEFKQSLVVVQLSFALLITIFWGILGIDYHYIAVVAVMAWGYGDAAAALVGKAIGRRRIDNKRIEGAKTVEGTHAMLVISGMAIFFTLLIYAGQSWYVSFIVAALVAPVSAVVELFSTRGMDTLTVPLATAISILSLVSLISFIGI